MIRQRQFSVILCALCVASVFAAPAEEVILCDKEKCPGPLKFYESVKCQAIYNNPGDCCAIRYDCDHLEKRSSDKCYAYGLEYNIGEPLRPEDEACLHYCSCTHLHEDDPKRVASFVCAVASIIIQQLDPGCYRAWNATTCYPPPQTCPEKPEDVPTCKVDGKILKDGDFFIPEAEPKKECWCGPGYKGENVSPFCKNSSPPDCGTDMVHGYELKHHCPPVYRFEQSPQVDCNYDWRCQNDKDAVIEKEKRYQVPDEKGNNSSTEGMSCQFGNITMQIGDELNQDTAFDSTCVKCVCEVPPVPTCQYLNPGVCDRWKVKLSV